MNDYWNDPPESPEPPECCDEIMDVEENGACVCAKCGSRVEPAPDIEMPDADPLAHEATVAPRCPHGNEWHECDPCAVASDLAYDAWRESRMN